MVADGPGRGVDLVSKLYQQNGFDEWCGPEPRMDMSQLGRSGTGRQGGYDRGLGQADPGAKWICHGVGEKDLCALMDLFAVRIMSRDIVRGAGLAHNNHGAEIVRIPSVLNMSASKGYMFQAPEPRDARSLRQGHCIN